MAPVLFKDVGKKANDLLKKEFISDNEFEIEQNTTNGLKFKANGKREGTGFNTDFEVEYKDKAAGLSVKEKLNAKNDLTLEVSLENKVANGLKVSVESTTTSGAPKALKAAFEYSNNSATSNVNIDLQKFNVDASATFAYDAFLIGAKTEFDTSKGSVNGADAVIQYTNKDFVVTAGLNSKVDEINATYIHNLPNNTTVAGTYIFNTTKGTNTFTVGGSYKTDASSSIKAKVDNNGLLSLLYSQSLNNNLTLNLGTTVKTNQLGTAGSQNIGVALKYSA
jgi:hypothetical protein